MNSPAPSSVVVDSCRRLVSRLAPHVVGASSPASPLRPQRSDIYLGTPQETRMLQLCLRLLSSRLAAGSIVDEIIVTEKLKKQASQQKDSRASLQLQDYLGRLKQKHVLNRRLQVLCVLANLSFSLDSSSASYVQYPCVSSLMSHLRLTVRRYVSFTLPAVPSSSQRLDVALPSALVVPSAPGPRPHKDAPSDTVPETTLLRDCLFVMHGIDGQV